MSLNVYGELGTARAATAELLPADRLAGANDCSVPTLVVTLVQERRSGMGRIRL